MVTHITNLFTTVYGHERELTKYILSSFLSWQMAIAVNILIVTELWEDFPFCLSSIRFLFFIGLGSIKAIFDICKKCGLGKN